ncbi:hypothetical protein TCAL_00334 [Tigriopus californicus]|uniref:Tyrosyl-DNA phosphodiesterase 2 n=1 Tax=Tigriopus californicus TaxID=6832 RepID=A0A553NF26_TIGCA|nr:tyrosyl-DNA phosphodiesterase 2-like [Tigriopus californicus]XP_059092320.1 tyrosyl-DNA phosphodiesterase 2-like [Tigriopus californicus]TRY64053.1 hypothetical protein TCAL_00334 [Tigriopus californicus]
MVQVREIAISNSLILHVKSFRVDMSQDEEDDHVPAKAECEARINAFVEVTNTNEALAQMMLQENEWNLDLAVADYFKDEQASTSAREPHRPRSGIPAEIQDQVTTKAPEKLSLVSWNIDGLDEKNLKARCRAIIQQIEHHALDIVCLQEVIPTTLAYLKDKLPHYLILSDHDKEADYFTAILLRRFTVYLDDFKTIPFLESRMGRDLMMANCHIGQAKLCIMTTHLESTREFAQERINQLSRCFREVQAVCQKDPSRTVILGGDLNLRDPELEQLGGLPPGLEDLWIQTGSRDACRYTWDLTRNNNLQIAGGRTKPRCRFDRLYIQDSAPRRLTAEYFGLFGIERVPGCQRFPSDHWGIMSVFKVKSNE